MKYKFRKVLSSQEDMPKEVDSTSSPFVTYVRKNIERVEVETHEGETTEMWEYEEIKLSKDEYEDYVFDVTTEDAICELSTDLDDRLADIENALCEISEMLDS